MSNTFIALVTLLLTNKVMVLNKGFKTQILESKKVKAEIINHLLKNLEAAHQLTQKTVQDKEIIGMFNTDTVSRNMYHIKKIETLDKKLNVLEDDTIQSHLTSYLTEVNRLLTNIYHMENHLYEYKKRTEMIKISYDRQYVKLRTTEESEDEALELKKSFKNELDSYQKVIKELDYTYENQREVLHQELVEQNNKNLLIRNMLIDYKRRNVDVKKFYPTKLVYA